MGCTSFLSVPFVMYRLSAMHPFNIAINRNRPLGVNWTLDMGAQSSFTIVFVAWPSPMFQTRQSPSNEPETMDESSGLRSTLVTGSPWAGISLTQSPDRTSQTLTVSSKLPVTYSPWQIRFQGLRVSIIWLNIPDVCSIGVRYMCSFVQDLDVLRPSFTNRVQVPLCQSLTDVVVACLMKKKWTD